MMHGRYSERMKKRLTEIIVCATVVAAITIVYIAGRTGAYLKEKADYYNDKASALRFKTLEEAVRTCTYAGMLKCKDEDEIISFTVTNVETLGIEANEDAVKTMCMATIYGEVV